MSNNLKKIFQIQKVLIDSGYSDISRISNEIYSFCDSSNTPIENVLERIANQEPWEYIQGYTEFCGYKFLVDRKTLIPRIETEQLVKIAVSLIKKNNYKQVIDVGTGSGCIIISIIKKLGLINDVKFCATDINSSTLSVAKKNAKLNCVSEKIYFEKTNLISGIEINDETLIVANLPYIPHSIYKNLDRSVIEYEPKNALVAGEDGLLYYKELIKQVGNKKVTMLIEIDPSISDKLQEYLKKDILVVKDLNNLDRFALFSLN